MRKWMTVGACLLILQMCLPAAAEKRFDNFYLALEGSETSWNQFIPSLSGGSGYLDPVTRSQWIGYGPNPTNPSEPVPQDPAGTMPAPTVPRWLNQWYYDDPYDPNRWKEISLDFTYQLLNPNFQGGFVITLNYTLANWPSDPVVPPLPGQDDQYIGRVQLASLWPKAGDNSIHTFAEEYDLRNIPQQGIPDFHIPFNPEWVSIDIAGYNILLSSPNQPGSFTHECVVPIPGAMAQGFVLMALGGAVLLCRRLRRRA